jgi:acyl carrier protein
VISRPTLIDPATPEPPAIPSPDGLPPSLPVAPEVTVEARVRAFITDFFYVCDPGSLTDDLSLIDTGLVDSTGMMDVIVFLESEFGFHIEDDEMVPENLESIGQIARFVASKRAGSSAGAVAPLEEAASA